MGIWYTTRERVQLTLEGADTSRSASLIDQKIEAASRAAEMLTHRRFYPELKTIKMDWPNYQYVAPWQLWLNDNEAISISSLTAGGTTISGSNYALRRGDDKPEPPYSYIEILQSSGSAFAGGVNGQQQSVVATLLTGWNDTDTSVPQASLGGAINSSVLTMVFNPSTGVYSDLGVGSLVLIGSERLQVIARRFSAVSGQTLTAGISDFQSAVAVPVTSGAAFAIDEVILIDSEKMRITDISGNTLICDRAHDGTVLDTHLINATVSARRTLTCRRGVLGSTAASHSSSDPVYVHAYPEPLPELVTAKACMALGFGDAEAIECLEESARYTLGRVARIGAI